MKLNPPKNTTFWVSVILAAAGVLVYAWHLAAKNIAYLQPAAFALVLVGFILLCLGLTVKGL
jgi:hypothetical protein